MTSFHPKPSNPQPVPPFPTRLLFPIHPPPPELTTPPPPLPSPARSLPPHSQFTHISTHIIPAAHLRSTPYVPLPKFSPGSEKEERKKAVLAFRSALDKVREDTASKRSDEGYERVLWNCVNRYVPKGRKDVNGDNLGVTLFLAHAHGFNKEIWETMLDYILSSSYQNIDEIWSFEAVQTGDAALINGGKLGAVYDCTDNTRDIANFLLHFLPSSTSSPHPTHLPRVPHSETLARSENGFSQRKLVGIGHSFGGGCLALAAATFPSLFTSLILIDPTTIKPLYFESVKDEYFRDLTFVALMRRSSWNSKEEAKASMLKNPFFAAWHPDVLQTYIDYGLYEHTSPPPPPPSPSSTTAPQAPVDALPVSALGNPNDTIVSLKMPPVQEALTSLDNLTHYESWMQLKDIDERISMHWIMPNPTTSRFGPPSAAIERVWRREKNASNVIIPQAGHLIPHEAPRECAEAIVNFLSKEYPDTAKGSEPRARL